MRLSPGEKLGPYEVIGLIGKGGMGEVYRATDTRLNRPVAIKVSAREFNDRFEREAQAISALNHPNIWATMATRRVGPPAGLAGRRKV